MGILFFIFVSIIILSAATLYIGVSVGNKTQFDKITHFFLAYSLFHVTYAFLVRLFPEGYQYIDRASPFGLLYGPLLYFAYLTSRDYVLERRTVFVHSIPLIIAIPFYIFFLVSYTSYFRTHSLLYYASLYGPMSLSWLGYSVYVAYKSTLLKEKVESINRVIPSMAVIVLFTLSFFLILSVLKRIFVGIPIVATTTTTSLMIFGGMLGAVIIVFLITIQQLKEKLNAIEAQEPLKKEDKHVILSAYEKSGLQDNEIREYVKRIDNYLSTKKYLDPNFSLSILSSSLKIPKHQLSQLFSQHYGASFLKYINGLRIEYACELLKNENYNFIIDELAEKCGFNSKTAFYRNFREIVGVPPSEYRESLN